MFHPLIGMPGTPELIVILIIVFLVFGAAKLPDLARGTGQALRIFKAETRGLKEDDEKAKAASTDRAALEAGDAANAERLAELDRRQAELEAERQRLNGGS